LNVVYADIPGAANANEFFPFGTSRKAKLAWLDKQNFDYMIFSPKESDSCLFSEITWKPSIGQNTMTGVWAPYVLEWLEFVNKLPAEVFFDEDSLPILAVVNLASL
jgi:hypothetical protein